MISFKRLAAGLTVPAALLAVLGLGTAPAAAQSGAQRKVYSAKFLCGEYHPAGVCVSGNVGAPCASDADCAGGGVVGVCEEREGPVKPGNYETAINVVNPTTKPFAFTKKAVLLFNSDPANPVPAPGTFEQPQPPGPLVTAYLDPNWGMEIDCPDIRQVLLGMPPPAAGTTLPFIKGFVVVEVYKPKQSLDIVAAYTSHGFSGVEGYVCSLPGTPQDGQPCDPADPTDPCFVDIDGDGVPDGMCVPGIVGLSAEGFSIDVEKVEPTFP